MDSKHIDRDYSAHRKAIVRPYDEYVKLEIFSFDDKYTSTYLREDNTLPQGKNCAKTSWKTWNCYKSEDKQNEMEFTLKYNCLKTGQYRIDLIYEQNDNIHKKVGKTNTNTNKDLVGHMTIGEEFDKNLRFDGEDNILKRRFTFVNLKKGGKKIKINVPHNCYFYGVIIRKVIKFVGDNYYGESLGDEKGNLVLTSCTLTHSDMTKARELSADIFYDDSLVDTTSKTGFYIDYKDECNLYVKTDDGSIKRVFGGYVSSILPDTDLKKLTIHCADRLIDGQNKYILDQMRLGGGTTDPKQSDYKNLTKDFDGYAQALEYICNIHEATLNSNISKQYTVDGEKFHEGFTVTFGTKKKIKNVSTTNGIAKSSKNFILLRNRPSSKKRQTWTLYEASKSGKTAPEITNYPYLHVTYGISEPKTTWSTKTTETVTDEKSSKGGSGTYNKCGQSSDGKTLMSIAKPSAGRNEGLSYNTFWKVIFENKCPYCGSPLVWDYGLSGADCVHCGPYSHSKNEWGDISESEVTCSSCCADFCGATGWDKDGSFSNRLKIVQNPVASSDAERKKLHQGEMSGASADDIFKAISKIAFNYRYSLDYGDSSYSDMKKSGVGECWAFSDLIFTELKRYKVSCRIMDYVTSESPHHRSVQYKNKDGKWTNFPYREYGWNTKYNNMLNDTGGVWGGGVVAEYKGNNIDGAKGVASTKTKTSNITHTKGYDKDKPFQGYLRITYSVNSKSFKAKKNNLDVKFTQTPTTQRSLSGMSVYWVNNTIKKATLRLENNRTLKDYFEMLHGKGCKIYLQGIYMITPLVEVKKGKDGKVQDTSWYRQDKSTDDQSSCKLNLYQITFDDNQGADPSDLSSCGKSVNAMLKDIVDKAGYYVDMEYGLHRKDDRINFRVNNSTKTKYTATEGDNNNILGWSSISYSPVSSLFNKSIQVFKSTKNTNQYRYIGTKDGQSILRYGEQTTLKTNSNVMSEKEAYFNAIYSDKFNPSQTYTYTITVPNCPNIKIGDLVKIVANAKKLNSVKEVKSLKLTFDSSKMPRIHTEIGLDELAPSIQLQKNLRKLREKAEKESTEFTSTATPVTEDIYYEWDT